MSKRERLTTEYQVGTFVIVGLFLLCLSLFLLGGESVLVAKYYNLNVQLAEVQGLSEGSIVSLSGVKVGNIEKIEFSRETNTLTLQLRINQKYREQIRQGSTASVRTQGALGDKYIFIEPASGENAVLSDGGALTAAVSGDVLKVLSEKGADFEKIFEILGELNVLLKRINDQGRSDKVMANLVDSSKNLNDMIGQTKALVLDIRANIPQNKELKKSVESFAHILEKIDNGNGTLGALINDPTVHNRLKAILGGSARNKHLKSLIRETIDKAGFEENSEKNP